jgi:hypothetical protein
MVCSICFSEINDNIYYRIVGTTEIVCNDCKRMLDRNEVELQRELNGEYESIDEDLELEEEENDIQGIDKEIEKNILGFD